MYEDTRGEFMKKNRWKLLSVAILMIVLMLMGIAGCSKDSKGNDTDGTISENVEGGSDLEANQDSKDEVGAADDQSSESGEGSETSEGKDSEAETDDTENADEDVLDLDESKAIVMKTVSNVNLRKEANTDCEVLQVISKGTELKKYAEENGWALVKVEDKVGYVSAEYIADPASIPEEPEVPVQSGSKVEAIPGQHRNPNSAVVVIDPGHQGRGDSTKEPNGPGSDTMKARVTSGTTGVATGVPEYVMNLEVSLKLKTELENRGYTVYMTRSTHDVNISNMERAQYASSVGADIAVRIHGNGSSNSSVHGVEAYAPSYSNPYVSHLAAASQSLGQHIVDKYSAATGFRNRGVFASDTMTGINWSEIPVTIIELGYMSNATEDQAMQDATMQNNMVQGIANGIDSYFGF